MKNWRRSAKNANDEYVLSRQVRAWIKARGGKVYMPPSMRQTVRPDGTKVFYQSEDWPAGVPDLQVCWQGKYVAIELKRAASTQRTMLGVKRRPAGRLSDHQKRELDAIQRAGGITIVAYCLEDVIRILDPAFLPSHLREVAPSEANSPQVEPSPKTRKKGPQ